MVVQPPSNRAAAVRPIANHRGVTNLSCVVNWDSTTLDVLGNNFAYFEKSLKRGKDTQYGLLWARHFLKGHNTPKSLPDGNGVELPGIGYLSHPAGCVKLVCS